jgi:hypothetical protein
MYVKVILTERAEMALDNLREWTQAFHGVLPADAAQPVSSSSADIGIFDETITVGKH